MTDTTPPGENTSPPSKSEAGKKAPSKPAAAKKTAAKPVVHPTVLKLSNLIFSDDWNRKEVGDIKGLTQSLKNQGQLIPITVRPHPDKPGKYIVIDGRLRCAALRDIGTKDVKVYVDAETTGDVAKDADRAYLESTIINYSRKNNTDYELGRVFQELTERGYKSKEIAQAFGAKEAFVSHRLSIFKLPNKWQEKVKKEQLTVTHARMLAPYYTGEDQKDVEVADKITESILGGKLTALEAQDRLDKYVEKKKERAAAKGEKLKGKAKKGDKKSAAAKNSPEKEEVKTAYTAAVQKEMKMITPSASREWCEYFESRLARTSSPMNRARIQGILEGLEISNGMRVEE